MEIDRLKIFASMLLVLASTLSVEARASQTFTFDLLNGGSGSFVIDQAVPLNGTVVASDLGGQYQGSGFGYSYGNSVLFFDM